MSFPIDRAAQLCCVGNLKCIKNRSSYLAKLKKTINYHSYWEAKNAVACQKSSQRTRRFADVLPTGGFQHLEPALLELAFALLRCRLGHDLLEDHDVELAFDEFDLALGELLFALAKALLLHLLLDGCPV